jgi:A/G-specific adenine glycosylase
MPGNARVHMTQTPYGLTEALLTWHVSAARDLPWRHTRNPWKILVSEVMSQQTQIDRVVAKWHEFIELWPTPEACADASLGDVLRVWQGLGYPRRAKHLHGAAIAIVELRYFPETLDGLLALPGVGPYTARAVLAFAFEQDVAVVDTNVGRVLARRAGQKLSTKAVQAAADLEVPAGKGWAWNQAILDLGASVCTARNPKCTDCPVSNWCNWKGLSEDPAVGSAGVSGKQARFEGSDRQARGRLMKVASQRPFLIDEVEAIIGFVAVLQKEIPHVEFTQDVQRGRAIAAALCAEGLLMQKGDLLMLPDG